MVAERRKSPRYLCSDQFSDSVLTADGVDHQLMSVNFSPRGIALYSHERLPEFSAPDQCLISFQLAQNAHAFKVKNLLCKLRRRHETEVGHQYGFQFCIDDTTDKENLESLDLIITRLSEQNDPENRYGLSS